MKRLVMEKQKSQENKRVNCQSALCFLLFLFLSTSLFSQDQVLQKIQTGFLNYSENDLQEKLFIHTDRSAYIAGETIWFKVYCVNAANNESVDLSKVAYAEVLNKDQQPVLQAKVALLKATGSGSFTLPMTLPSGNYIFRAYTNWMKNYSPEFYFQKTVRITNTIQNETPQTEKVEKHFDVQFFPEGGDLVNGLQSKVAFRATDETGKGIEFSGAIINENNDTLVRFYPATFGIG